MKEQYTPPKYGYTDVFEEDGTFYVNRLDRYEGDSYTVVECPTKEAADAAHRLLSL